MDGDTRMITLIIGNVEHEFYGDELISPEQQAILFLLKRDEDKREF